MPKVSASIELLWQLACREAIAGRFAAIEPEHFCMALLKLAEIPSEQLEKLSPNGGQTGKELAEDVQAVQKDIARLGVDSTQARRKLRASLGKGDAAYDGGEMHRSEKSRVLFDEAARETDKAGSDVLTVRHLLAAIAANPTPAIREVLLAGGQAARDSGQLPALLSRWGTDLTALAAKGELREEIGRAAEAKSVMKAVRTAGRKSVFLVSDASGPVDAVFVCLALAAMKETPSSDLRRLRIVDVTGKLRGEKPDEPPVQFLHGILAEASQVGNIVLRIPDIENTQQADVSLGVLKSATAAAPFWACRVTHEIYRQRIQRDAHWRRAATAVTVQNEIQGGIPNEL